MSTLPEFLLARIGEDEATARGATYSPQDRWEVSRDGEYLSVMVRPYNGAICEWDSAALEQQGISLDNQAPLANHIARWDPARVLAECEARRGVVMRANLAVHVSDRVPEDEPDEVNDNGRKHGIAQAWETALACLAAPYSDHPDFDPDWLP